MIMSCVTFSPCVSRRLFKLSLESSGNTAHLASSAPVLNDSTVILWGLCVSSNLWPPTVVWHWYLIADRCMTSLHCRHSRAIESTFVEEGSSHGQETCCVWVLDGWSQVIRLQLVVKALRTSKRNKTGLLASKPQSLISRVYRRTQLVSPSWSFPRKASWPRERAFFLILRVSV